MSLFPLKPTHKPVKDYYAALAQFQLHGHTTEGNTHAFLSQDSQVVPDSVEKENVA